MKAPGAVSDAQGMEVRRLGNDAGRCCGLLAGLLQPVCVSAGE